MSKANCLFLSLLFFLPAFGYSQDIKFRVMPYLNGITSGKEGYIEAGPEFNWQYTIIGQTLILRPSVRLPLTEANENTLQIDRYTPTWRAVLDAEFGYLNTLGCIQKNGFSIGLQAEYGLSQFKYFPVTNINNEVKETKSSFALEVKLKGFFTAKRINAAQFAPQFRFRYSRNANQPIFENIVNLPDSRGITTTSNKVTDKAFSTNIFSPAFAFLFFPGDGNFAYAPAIFYDLVGPAATNPNSTVGRARLEYGVYFYPLIKAYNVRIGLTPFVNIRTNGMDSFKMFEYGGQISMSFGTNFLQFF